MRKKKKLFQKKVYAALPLQFIYIEEVPPFNKKTKTSKVYVSKNNTSDEHVVASFYKPISKLF